MYQNYENQGKIKILFEIKRPKRQNAIYGHECYHDQFMIMNAISRSNSNNISLLIS
jgi:hypothetical protein